MSDDAAVDVPGRREALLAQYRQPRRDSRRTVDGNDRRFVRGVAVIGLVVGYALRTDTQTLVVFVPLLLGFLYVLYVLSSGALVLVGCSEQHVRRELLAERSRGS